MQYIPMIWSIIVLYVAAIAAVPRETLAQARVVQTAQGPVRGYRASDGNYFGFYNIPYATVPTGKQKFMPPLPAPTWEETLEAVDEGVLCPQFGIDVYGKQTEDCLITNVLIPETNQTNLPVLAYFHGGAYQVGYGNINKYTNVLNTGKFIVVNFNYRLAVHGFLCLGTEYAPGNSGLKDQIAGLRWIKENIASFGGNPDDVTIYGQSAGAAAVDLLMISNAAEGLFEKVIVDSGSNVALWASEQDPIKKSAEYAVKYLNYTGSADDIYALEDLYVNLPIDLLISVVYNYPDGSFYFQPCVERHIGIEMAIDEAPVKILENGNYRKVPLLYGFTEAEASVRAMDIQYLNSENYADYMPGDLEFDNDEQKEEIYNKVKRLYFENKEPGLSSVIETLSFMSDYSFIQPMLRAVKLHKENGHDQVYLYRYHYYAEEEVSELDSFGIKAAQHTAQAIAFADYLLDHTEMTLPEEYRELKATIRNFYINFIVNGTPSPVGEKTLGPEWIPVTETVTRSPHMFFDNSVVELVYDQIDENRTQLWDEIYSKYYKYPLPPPVPATRHNSGTSLSSLCYLVILSVAILYVRL